MDEASILGSTQNGDAGGVGENALSFNDSDFYLNMDDVDIGPQIGQGAFSKVYLGRYLGELVSLKSQVSRGERVREHLPLPCLAFAFAFAFAFILCYVYGPSFQALWLGVLL